MARWQIEKRRADDLLEHLCLVRNLDPLNLTPSFTEHLHDPNLLPDMDKARAVMRAAVKNQSHITIFGDYDADGTPASVILALLCDQLGLKWEVILPLREEGYGIKMHHVEATVKKSQVLITVDTGINSVEEVAAAKAAGLDVIILDHHLPKSDLPPADAIVDPFMPGSRYPFSYLCGCALAYKLVVALAADFPDELPDSFTKWLLDLVAVSTVADMMPLVGENRVLVHYGLEVLRKNRRPGLRALMAVAGIEPNKIGASHLGFALGPRLNASGRIGDNRPSFELLMSRTDAEAEPWAALIDRANRERQSLVKDTLLRVKALLWQQNQPDDRCLVVVGDDLPAGILGLVAGKLTSEFFRPAIVTSKSGDVITGSARSIGEYSIIDGLTSQEKLLTRFGGHRQAAGLSGQSQNWPKFVDGLKQHAARQISAADLVPTYRADGVLASPELTLETVERLKQLEPFGLDNPLPTFVLEKVVLGPVRTMGATGDHVKWQARHQGQELEVVGFGLTKRWQAEPLKTADLLGQLEQNTWKGQTRLQFKLTDYRPVDESR